MDLATLKHGDPIYWMTKKRPRNGVWKPRPGSYEGMVGNKVLVYCKDFVKFKGPDAKGKLFEIDPDQIVNPPG